MAIKGAFVILILAVVLSLGVNLVSPHKISLVGTYRELQGGDEGPIVPPSAAKGDPPFISISDAYMEYQLGTAVFIDARDPEEFECGTIPGSINIPFDYLPETDLKPYFDSVLVDVPADKTIITFCSGEECDLSLHLARNMQALGYSRLLIFFGGAREWENSGLDVERRRDCES